MVFYGSFLFYCSTKRFEVVYLVRNYLNHFFFQTLVLILIFARLQMLRLLYKSLLQRLGPFCLILVRYYLEYECYLVLLRLSRWHLFLQGISVEWHERCCIRKQEAIGYQQIRIYDYLYMKKQRTITEIFQNHLMRIMTKIMLMKMKILLVVWIPGRMEHMKVKQRALVA